MSEFYVTEFLPPEHGEATWTTEDQGAVVGPNIPLWSVRRAGPPFPPLFYVDRAKAVLKAHDLNLEAEGLRYVESVDPEKVLQKAFQAILAEHTSLARLTLEEYARWRSHGGPNRTVFISNFGFGKALPGDSVHRSFTRILDGPGWGHEKYCGAYPWYEHPPEAETT